MDIVVLTTTRLLGDGLMACLGGREGFTVVAVARDLADLGRVLGAVPVDVALIDVSLGIDLFDVRALATAHPEVPLLALGLSDQRQDVIRCGEAGFVGYVNRTASLDELCKALRDAVEGRLACPAEIAAGLMRALFRGEHAIGAGATEQPLTKRETQVLHLLGQGLSNKDIARTLCLSVATVKHHVHNILEKLHVPCRAQAMRRARDTAWLVPVQWPSARGRAGKPPSARSHMP